MQFATKPNPGKPLYLRPLLDRQVSEIIGQKGLLNELLRGFGSPLNIVVPNVLDENALRFHEVMRKHQVNGRLFFAHKPTQSSAVLRQAAANQMVNADVASVSELRHALGCGFSGTRLMATGPKSPEFLALCLQHEVVVNLDSIGELRQLLAIHKFLHMEKRCKVLLRVSGFDLSPLAKASRFGTPLKDVEDVLRLLKEAANEVDLIGFAFHLDTEAMDERLQAISKCLDLFDAAIDLGFTPKVLDIGGGFKINYLAYEEDWLDFTSAFQASILGNFPSLTWHNEGHGLWADQGVLRGTLNSKSYYEAFPGERFLDKLLNSQLPGTNGSTVAKAVANNMFELWIEPGKSLVDQVGFTVSRVLGVRQSSRGDDIVQLEMKRSDVTATDREEAFLDPIVLVGTPPHETLEPSPVFFAGHLCLENDLVLRRLTWIAKLPEPGDLVVFPNTGEYRTSLSSSPALMQPTAQTVAVVKDGERFVWFQDKNFSPVWRLLNGK